jgi:hypothetical protein
VVIGHHRIEQVRLVHVEEEEREAGAEPAIAVLGKPDGVGEPDQHLLVGPDQGERTEQRVA